MAPMLPKGAVFETAYTNFGGHIPPGSYGVFYAAGAKRRVSSAFYVRARDVTQCLLAHICVGRGKLFNYYPCITKI